MLGKKLSASFTLSAISVAVDSSSAAMCLSCGSISMPEALRPLAIKLSIYLRFSMI